MASSVASSSLHETVLTTLMEEDAVILPTLLNTSFNSLEPTLETACSKVHELLKQVSNGDSPPLNDFSEETSHLSSPTSIGNSSSFDTDSSSIGAFVQDLYVPKDLPKNMAPSASVMAASSRIGNAPLMALCSWTLEQIQGVAPILSAPTPSPRLVSPKTQPTCTVRSKRAGFWKKEEEKKEEYIPRLQMFASEYARYLSKSQLAPPPCRSKAARRTFRNKPGHHVQTICLEDADPAILTGALLDLCVTYEDEPPPKGYYRLTQSASGQPIPLARKKLLYLNVKKEVNWDKAAQRPTITAISIIFPDRQEFVPPGFCVVKNPDKVPANFMDADSERCYMVFRRSREGNPITGLLPLMPPESVPAGYTVVERTPRNHVANMNTSGAPLFWAYRQRLANLESLRPFPLVRAAQPKAGAHFTEDDDEVMPQLHAYYATGGTTVSATVGRFHILDRSTHSLLSPSSIANRLQRIQLSRRKPEAAVEITSDDFDDNVSGLDVEASHDAGDIPVYILSHFLMTTTETGAYSHNIHQTMESMSFIPQVQIAVVNETTKARLQMRTAVLTPILTACYTRHGGAARVAVHALTDLLVQGFFQDDIFENGRPQLSLLDLSIQTVCDVATCFATEMIFGSCVDFIAEAVRICQGYIPTRTLGYVLRLYLFVFYFGASVPSLTDWPQSYWRLNSGENDDDTDFILLDDPRKESSIRYLPGGAPQAAALAFKELISFCVVRLGKVSVSDASLSTEASQRKETMDITSFLETVVSSLVGDAVDHVERANFTQLAYHQIHRSGGSELFWHDMVNTCGMGLFGKDKSLGDAGKDVYNMTFSLLANLVKVSLGKMRPKNDRSFLLPRDSASKLLSLELLLHFLELWSDEQEALSGLTALGAGGNQRAVETLAFAVRRMVVPALISNTRSALEDPQVFSRVICIVSELWGSPVYRKYCKVELGILIEQFCLKLLQLGPQFVSCRKLNLWSDKAHLSLLDQQVELIKEVKNWFSGDPKDLIELFLNYDTDMCSDITGPIQLLPGTQWKIFQRLCDGLSNIAEQCGEVIGDQIRENQSKIMSKTKTVGAQLANLMDSTIDTDITDFSESAVREAARLLRKTSLETISQIVKSLAVSAAASSGNKFTSLLLSWSPGDSPIAFENCLHSPVARSRKSTAEDEEEPYDEGKGASKKKGEDEILRFWRDAIAADQQERLASAVPSSQESLQVALEIARRKNLKKAIEYLIASSALSPSPRDIANFLRINKEHLDPAALGLYLSETGIASTESEFWASVRHLYVRATTFIGMTLEESLRHFLTDCGFRLPGEAQRIDRIMSTFARCYFEDNAGDSHRCPFKHEDSVYLLSFAIIMLNTDLHKVVPGKSKARKRMTKAEFINNLKGTEQGHEFSKEYLGMIYDLIEAAPIELHGSEEQGADNPTKLLRDMVENVKTADSLMRGLAVHDFHFATINDFISGLEYGVHDALGDLTRSCVSKTWHQWHGVINTGLETAHLDPTGMEPCVDILHYALAITVCLDMPTERAAFLRQLGRLKDFEERRQGRWATAEQQDTYQNDEWYVEIEEACSGAEKRKLSALRRIHEWMVSLKRALQEDVKNKVHMKMAVSELKGGEYLLQDPARSFRRSGDLVKKSSRTGRSTPYRFFLFSDVLLYAKEEADGRFKIHEELPLHLLKIIDWFPPTQKNGKLMFEVNHPRKTFFVICKSADERKSWVVDVKSAMNVEMERKMKVEALRMALYTR